jgi:hypothetical protein
MLLDLRIFNVLFNSNKEESNDDRGKKQFKTPNLVVLGGHKEGGLYI